MKLLFVFFFCCLSAGVTRASYLYWQVDTTDSDAGQGLAAALAAYDQLRVEDLVGARLIQVDNADGSRMISGAVGQAGFNAVQDAEIPTINISAMGKRYSYYIEYISKISQNYTVVATSKTLTYEALVNMNAVYVGSELSVPEMTTWSGTSFAPAPEPTTNILFALGMSFLILKRKRIYDG